MLRLVYITIAIAILAVPLAMGCDSGGSRSILDGAVFGTGGLGGTGAAGVATGGTGGKAGTGGSAGVAGQPVAKCGNGTIDTGEECDGANLGGETCGSLHTGATGNLACVSCQYDETACITGDTGSGYGG